MITSLKDKRFHTNVFSIYSFLPYKRETLPVLRLLIAILKNKAKGYKTLQDIVAQSEELYGLDYSVQFFVADHKIALHVTFAVVDEGYVEEKKILQKAFKFIYKLFFELYEGRFTSKLIKEQKEMVISQMKMIFNRPSYIASEGLYNMLDSSWPLSIPLYGTIEEVENVEKEQLIELHKNLIAAPKCAYFVGPVSKNKAEKLLNKYFTLNSQIVPFDIFSRSSRDEVESVLTKDIEQSIVKMAYVLDQEATREEVLILNALIGGLGTSRLFKEIREKLGLCYSINSTISPYHKFLFISAGVNITNIELTKNSIKKLMSKIKFTKEELLQAKTLICSSLITSLDSNFSLLTSLVSASRRNTTFNMKQIIKDYKKVSLKRINYLAKALLYQGTFTLKGVK